MKNLKMMFPKPMIRREIYRLSEQLSFQFKDVHIIIVGKGGLFFATDVIRFMAESVTGISYITCSSYKGTISSSSIEITGTISEDVYKKDVIIIDDICDTGVTLAALKKHLEKDTRSIKTAVLINNKARRVIDYDPDFSCFEMNKDVFLVGYGMDLDNRYRSLDSIYSI